MMEIYQFKNKSATKIKQPITSIMFASVKTTCSNVVFFLSPLLQATKINIVRSTRPNPPIISPINLFGVERKAIPAKQTKSIISISMNAKYFFNVEFI